MANGEIVRHRSLAAAKRQSLKSRSRPRTQRGSTRILLFTPRRFEQCHASDDERDAAHHGSIQRLAPQHRPDNGDRSHAHTRPDAVRNAKFQPAQCEGKHREARGERSASCSARSACSAKPSDRPPWRSMRRASLVLKRSRSASFSWRTMGSRFAPTRI